MTPGACPHDLAAEVYARTMRCVRRRYGHNPKHSQVMHDAVGEAFIRWFKSPADKTAHSANEHARWMTSTAGAHILDTDPCRRKYARAIRSLATHAEADEWDEERAAVRREAALRRDRDAPDFAYAEDNIIEALDAIRAPPPSPIATHQEALAVLKHRGWLDREVARILGVSRPTIGNWRSGAQPTEAAVAALMSLVAKDDAPPAHLRYRQRRPPQPAKRR